MYFLSPCPCTPIGAFNMTKRHELAPSVVNIEKGGQRTRFLDGGQRKLNGLGSQQSYNGLQRVLQAG